MLLINLSFENEPYYPNMPSNQFFAHSSSDDVEKGELLFSESCPALKGKICADCENLNREHGHLNKVAYYQKVCPNNLSIRLRQYLIFSQLAYIQGLWYDLGKFSEEFQSKLNGVSQHVDHSTIGAQQADNVFPKHRAFNCLRNSRAPCRINGYQYK